LFAGKKCDQPPHIVIGHNPNVLKFMSEISGSESGEFKDYCLGEFDVL
jgi:hypothetical protein